MPISRNLTPQLLKAASKYPVVTVTGPRQAGKTTLVREVFPDHGYANLENPEIRRLAEDDPKSFFALHDGPHIFDEIQNVSSLLSWIQVKVDEDKTKTKGHFILTGSHQPKLREAVGQSLAGRTAMLTLLPFSFSELKSAGYSLSKEAALFRGFLPRVYDDDLDPLDAYRDYFRTYVERDVRDLLRVKDSRVFSRFIRLLAGRVGQVINMNGLANDVGVSHTTITEWLSVLEASFIVFSLPPYYQNFGKRLIKSPKIYFTETGLATWLLGIETEGQVLRDPLHGSLFENMVVADAWKERAHQGREPNLYFWRDSNGHEVDLIWDRQRRLVPIEIKSAMTWNDRFPLAIQKLQKNVPVTDPGYVISACDLRPETESYQALPFHEIEKIFRE